MFYGLQHKIIRLYLISLALGSDNLLLGTTTPAIAESPLSRDLPNKKTFLPQPPLKKEDVFAKALNPTAQKKVHASRPTANNFGKAKQSLTKQQAALLKQLSKIDKDQFAKAHNQGVFFSAIPAAIPAFMNGYTFLFTKLNKLQTASEITSFATAAAYFLFFGIPGLVNLVKSGNAIYRGSKRYIVPTELLSKKKGNLVESACLTASSISSILDTKKQWPSTGIFNKLKSSFITLLSLASATYGSLATIKGIISLFTEKTTPVSH